MPNQAMKRTAVAGLICLTKLSPAGPPMTREQFLADPVNQLRIGIEPAWIVTAYRAGGRFREDVIDWISQSVSKIGNMGQAAFWVKVLADKLDGKEAAYLYGCIRDRSERLEFEWRSEFETAFPSVVGMLPPRQDGWYFDEAAKAVPRSEANGEGRTSSPK